jgi:hypothetical protein
MGVIFFPIFHRNRVDSVLFQGKPQEQSPSLDFERFAHSLSNHRSNTTLIFPSHIFEHPSFFEILTFVQKREMKFKIQISLGAEFYDYQAIILGALPKEFSSSFLGLELAIDRSLNAKHFEQIKLIEDGAIPFQLLCVPKSDLQPVSFLKSIPEKWLEKTTVFFPKKIDRFDSNLSSEEIFLLKKKLQEQRPNFPFRINLHMVDYYFPKMSEAIPSNQYRANPSEESFAKLYPLLGNYPNIRKLSYQIFGSSFFRPIFVVPYGFFWLLHDPVSAISMPLRFFRKPMILFYKLFDLCVWLLYRFFEIFWLIRHIAIMFFVFSWRTLTRLQLFSISLYHLVIPALLNFLKHPLWYLKEWSPITFYLTVFPIQKIYWFAEFQIQKRLLKTREEKDA